MLGKLQVLRLLKSHYFIAVIRLKCPAMLEAAGEAPSCLEVKLLPGPERA